METTEMTHDEFVAAWHKNNRTITRNGVNMRFSRYMGDIDPKLAAKLVVIDTSWYISGHMGVTDIAKAAGIHTFDTVFPIDWLRETYWNQGLDTPLGVWSYDDNRVFGEFVSIQRMFEKMAIAQELSD